MLRRTELSKGIFGENLTISGLDEANLHIGDQLTIGECVLEITQPRVPCHKLSIAVGNKDMPRLFIEHFATGIYMRVIKEGLIESGNQVVVTKQAPSKVSIKSLFRASFDKTTRKASLSLQKHCLFQSFHLNGGKKYTLLNRLNCEAVIWSIKIIQFVSGNPSIFKA